MDAIYCVTYLIFRILTRCYVAVEKIWLFTDEVSYALYANIILLSRFWGVTIDGVWIGEFDLLIICIHYSELQVIIALSLISTLYKSPQHPLSPFSSLLCLQQPFPSKWILTMEILQLLTLISLLSGEYPATVNCQLNYSAISSQPPLQSSTHLPTLN
jgi:hypothetical protein